MGPIFHEENHSMVCPLIHAECRTRKCPMWRRAIDMTKEELEKHTDLLVRPADATEEYPEGTLSFEGEESGYCGLAGKP